MLALVILALAGGGSGSWWYVNAHLRPTRPCPKCEGEKYTPVMFSNGKRFRLCGKCEGAGEILTWAARQSLKRRQRIAERAKGTLTAKARTGAAK